MRISWDGFEAATLVWIRLQRVAQQARQTIYQVKHDLLSDLFGQQLKSLFIKMTLE